MLRRALPLVALAFLACGSSDRPVATATPTDTPTASPTETETATATPTATQAPARRTVATGLAVPWGIAFLPGRRRARRRARPARILRIPAGGGEPRAEMQVPGVDTDAGEGGLLGLAVSPYYARDRLVYAYFTSAVATTASCASRSAAQVRPVLTGIAAAGIHDGGRIAFGPDGKLYAGVGDAGDTSNAQDRGSLNGKILRMNPDGSVPGGQPVRRLARVVAGPPQRAGARVGRAGRLWATEFGQNTWDEVNLIRPGRNYGWPLVEGRGSTSGGRFVNPLVTWSTGEASPSGAAIVGSTLYVAALHGECVWRIPCAARARAADAILLAAATVASAPSSRRPAGRDSGSRPPTATAAAPRATATTGSSRSGWGGGERRSPS